MNLKDLESPVVKNFDDTINKLIELRKEFIKSMSKEQHAYYNIQDSIKRLGYNMSVGTVMNGYKFWKNGESYSCSVDSVCRDVKGSCKVLYDAGYGR